MKSSIAFGPAGSELLFYQTEDGQTRLQVRLEGETVWLTQAQMAELFQASAPNVSMHIRNPFDKKELSQVVNVKEFLTVQTKDQATLSIQDRGWGRA